MTTYAAEYVLAAGGRVTVTDDTAVQVRVFSGPSPQVIINGVLESHVSSGSTAWAIGIRYDAAISSVGVVQVGASGAVRAISDDARSATAYGVYAGSIIDLTNDGRIEVTTNDSSVG